MSNKWSAKAWSGLTEFSGRKVWLDGEDIYYSDGSTQKVLNKSTSTWEDKDWGQYTSAVNPVGEYMFVYNGYIYCLPGTNTGYYYSKNSSEWGSAGFSYNYTTQKLDGRCIWTDGTNCYYCKDSTSGYSFIPSGAGANLTTAVFKKNGIKIDGDKVWTDGENIYYSKGSQQYVFDATKTDDYFGTSKTWNGLTSFDGDKVWTDGENIYYSADGSQYILDKATSTWTEQIWTGLTSFSGNDIWSDGTDTYYSNAANQYMLGEPAPTEVYLSKMTLPVKVNGETSPVEFTFKDAEARQEIEDLGHALYWLGITTTVMSDGLTTADVTIGGETVTPNIGAVVSYNDDEYVWNGTAWQAFGHANFGDLAYEDSASGSYTPAGTVEFTKTADSTASISTFGAAGTLPNAYFTVTGETAVFNFSAGTLPTAGTPVTAVTATGTNTAAFTGTAATITVE